MSDEKDVKSVMMQRAKECEYLLGKDGYFFSTMHVAASHEFLTVWHILKEHVHLPTSTKGIFRSITLNATSDFNEAIEYISGKRTVHATNLRYDLNAADTPLPFDRAHQIRKVKIDISLQTNGNKIDMIYAHTKTVSDVVAAVAIAQTTKDFGQLHILRLPPALLEVGILLLGLFYSHMYPIVFPWTEDVYICAKCKMARDCNKTFDIFVKECSDDKFDFANAIAANAQNEAIILEKIKVCFAEIALNDEYDTMWTEEFI